METRSNGRAVHWLRKNHGTRSPHSLIFLDTEANRHDSHPDSNCERHTLMLGVASHVRLRDGVSSCWHRCIFYKPETFWAWLTQFSNPKHSLWIFGHNLAYDLTLLRFWELLDDGYLDLGWEREKGRPADKPPAGDNSRGFLCLSDPPFIVSAKCAGVTYKFVDTRNYWPTKLSALAESSGLPKLPMPGEAADGLEWEAYCTRDVEILEKAVVNLISRWRKEDLGEFKFTAAGLAWHAYRHRFMEDRSILIDDSGRARELERDALAGGETRCYFAGRVLPESERQAGRLFTDLPPEVNPRRGPVYVLDASSFYASVMRDNYFPRRLIAYLERGSLRDYCAWEPYLCMIGRVRLETRGNTYPVLLDGERSFAVGRYWTTLCGPELRRAVEAGEVIDWGPLAAYERGYLFRKWVDWGWALRREAAARGDVGGVAFAKLLLNSLPGKFGQKSQRWTDTGEIVHTPRWGPYPRSMNGKPLDEQYRVVAGYVQQESRPEETKDSFPAITAFVTSYGRLKLNEMVRSAGPGHVLYTDTDSLHVDVAGLEALSLAGYVRGETLGGLRIVGSAQRAEYRGLKDYTLDGVHTIAGLKGSSREVSPGVFEVELWEGPAGIVGRGPDGTVSVHKERFRVGRLHHRGRLLPTGEVLPAKIIDGVLADSAHTLDSRDSDIRRKRRQGGK